MAKLKQLPDIHEVSVKGQKIFDNVSKKLEREHFGKIIVIRYGYSVNLDYQTRKVRIKKA